MANFEKSFRKRWSCLPILISFFTYGSGAEISSLGSEGPNENYRLRKGDTVSDLLFDRHGARSSEGLFLYGPDGMVDRVLKLNQIDSLGEDRRLSIGREICLSIDRASCHKKGEYDSKQPDHVFGRVVGLDSPKKQERTIASNEEVKDFAQSAESEGPKNSGHNLSAKIFMLNSDLSGKQTAGPGAGTSANEILSDVRFSIDLGYKYNFNNRWAIESVLGLRDYFHSKNLSNSVQNDHENYALRGEINAIFTLNRYLKITMGGAYDQQLYYYGELGSGALKFDTENTWGTRLKMSSTFLNQEYFGLGVSGIAGYYWGSDLLDSSYEWGFGIHSNLFSSKNWIIELRYLSRDLQFVSSDSKHEILEIGGGYRWTF